MDFDLNEIPIEELPNIPIPPDYESEYRFIDLNECYQEEDMDDHEEEKEEDEEELHSSANNMVQPQNRSLGNKKKNMTFNLKRAIIENLMQACINGKLGKGEITNIANRFSVSTRSVSRLWHDLKTANANGVMLDISSKMIDLELIKSIPLRRRTSMRSLACLLNLSTSTIHRRIRDGNLKPHSSTLRPDLTDDNKKERVEFCLKMITEGMNVFRNPSFIDMYDRIHIDEKWFYITKTSQKYYLHAEEDEPLRTCKSKRFITKIMFLTVVDRLRFDHAKQEMFDGKIGIWPFVIREAAKRNSKNLFYKKIIQNCMINELLPAIVEKWPFTSYKTVIVQQDNARPHVHENDEKFMQAVRSYGVDIRLLFQPPNSPDLNVLDLGFFRAIAALQHKDAPTTVDEFIASVTRAFELFSTESSNNVMNQLPVVLQCDSQVVNEARAYISGDGSHPSDTEGVVLYYDRTSNLGLIIKFE
ncbi:hypothetical protein MKW98_023972 [Papaver atlanticum]|uniref:DUF7769 domain-containing protein n=1 Tax=Papaver atlanticum TaxID=357466 RepID=A0AAD4XNL0_9MAGN|nr:hypothetical protein MKW98_023972 [Papaver atlanticum]